MIHNTTYAEIQASLQPLPTFTKGPRILKQWVLDEDPNEEYKPSKAPIAAPRPTFRACAFTQTGWLIEGPEGLYGERDGKIILGGSTMREEVARKEAERMNEMEAK